jgi:hypothetical protein
MTPTTTIEELRDLVAQSIASTEAYKARSEAFEARITASIEASDKERRELRQQIGGLHNKFGSFTEGLLLPTVKRILRDDMGLEHVSERTISNRTIGGVKTFLELDALGYANGERNLACIAEIKSHLREDGLAQILRQLEDFPTYFPNHASKQLYGLIAAVDAPESLKRAVWDAGLYLVLVHDDSAAMVLPDGFVPRNYGAEKISG